LGACGQCGPFAFWTLIPPRANATKADWRIWRLLAQGRARVIHIGNPETSPFKDLAEAYELTDEALMKAINSHQSSRVWPPEADGLQ
jgi:hypothetical protein